MIKDHIQQYYSYIVTGQLYRPKFFYLHVWLGTYAIGNYGSFICKAYPRVGMSRCFNLLPIRGIPTCCLQVIGFKPKTFGK